MNLKKYKLKRTDKVAVVAPSSGKALDFSNVYNEGIKNIEEIFGLTTIEYPTVKMSNDQLYNNPKLRAKDINDAFANPSIKGIITAIGGDDSVRILPFLDKEIIQNNPKLFIGYSDASAILTYLNQLGLVSFHGPSVMAGFAQTKYLPRSFENHVNSFLFIDFDTYEYSPYHEYCDGYKDWALTETGGGINDLNINDGWHWINGKNKISGTLFGGCIEALEFLKSTSYWPSADFWNRKILFLETSEEKPTIDQIKRMLRNYGTQGVLNKISALFFGRPIFYSYEEKQLLDKMILNVVVNEFGASEIPIITNMDFGHTDPQLILPLGMEVKINCEAKTVTLLNN